jgi:hypothetical protein
METRLLTIVEIGQFARFHRPVEIARQHAVPILEYAHLPFEPMKFSDKLLKFHRLPIQRRCNEFRHHYTMIRTLGQPNECAIGRYISLGSCIFRSDLKNAVSYGYDRSAYRND